MNEILQTLCFSISFHLYTINTQISELTWVVNMHSDSTELDNWLFRLS